MTYKRPHKYAQPVSEVDSGSASDVSPRVKWLMGASLLCVAVGFLIQRSRHVDDLARLEREGGPILEAAVSWREQQGKLGCPTISQLIQDRFLPKSAQQGGKRFRILCSADEVHLEQLGDDGRPLAEDALRLNQQVAPHEG